MSDSTPSLPESPGIASTTASAIVMPHDLSTALPPQVVLDALDRAARKGRLPGLTIRRSPPNTGHAATANSAGAVAAHADESTQEARPANGRSPADDGSFTLTDFGRPFESILVGTLWPGPGSGLLGLSPVTTSSTAAADAPLPSPPATLIRLQTRVKPAMPIFFGVILLLTIWPGILLTDSMLKLYFSWYTIPTWWWYLPLTVPFSPLAWRKAWRQSRSSAAIEVSELVATIGATLRSAELERRSSTVADGQHRHVQTSEDGNR